MTSTSQPRPRLDERVGGALHHYGYAATGGGRDPAPAARFPNCSRQTVSRTAAGKRTAKKLIFLSELMVGAQEVGQASLINDLALGAGV
jgi:hypothetical protein